MHSRSDIVKSFQADGIYIFGNIFKAQDCAEMLRELYSKREFGKDIFITEEEYKNVNSHWGVNPKKRFSLFEELKNDFIFSNKELLAAIKLMIGDDYEIVINKLVCAVPESWLPQWVLEKISGANIANLGIYIKPQYRDITYFRGIDYHQDLIDWPKNRSELDPSTFITCYIYLHDVSSKESPLHIIPKSHLLGATTFPHKLKKISDKKYIYEDDERNSIQCEAQLMTGSVGYCAMWNSFLLHGTKPTEKDNPRISVRLLLAKNPKNKNPVGIDFANSVIKGKMALEKTREDIDSMGRIVLKNNIINKEAD